jgi:hypothetical protein
MNVNRRDRREPPAGERGAERRTPRSGGRTAAARPGRTGAPGRAAGGRDRGDYEYPTQGGAALRPRLRPESVEPARTRRASAAAGRARATATGTRSAESPRLRVAPLPPSPGPRVPFAALVLVLVVGGMLGILVVNSKVNENAFRLNDLRKEQAALDVQEQQLEQRIAAAEVPGNLAAAARKLGLVESGPLAFIRLQDGRVLGVPQPAVGAPSVASRQGAED